jgi:hypothetical protein
LQTGQYPLLGFGSKWYLEKKTNTPKNNTKINNNLKEIIKKLKYSNKMIGIN